MKTKMLLLLSLCFTIYTGMAQESKKEVRKESREEKKERHKQFCKKAGNDQRDFWKNEHEKHIAKQEERKAGKGKDKESGKNRPSSGSAGKKADDKSKATEK